MAAGVTGEQFVSGDWSTRCAALGLTKPESYAAFDAFFSSSVPEGWREGWGSWGREMELEEYKEYLQFYARVTDALGCFNPSDYRKALESIGLGPKPR